MAKHPAVHVVDDDESVADACRFLLEGYGYPVAYWAAGEAFLTQADLYRHGCVILDVRMPGMTGDAVQRELAKRGSTLGVIMLTAHGDIGMAVDAMKSGAVDFLQKPVAGRELTQAVQAALRRSQALKAQYDLRARLARLSEREKEVAELVSAGLTNREIAAQLHLAVRTIEVHRASAMRKLRVDGTVDLAKLWQLATDGRD